MTKVENLKNITLSLQAGTASDRMDFPLKYSEFMFVFGIAPEGMSPFEYELLEKTEGDEILLHLKKDNHERIFEHLKPPIGDLFVSRDEIYLKVNILEISTADNRQIVKAMADMTDHAGGGCGCGGGCECGCG